MLKCFGKLWCRRTSNEGKNVEIEEPIVGKSIPNVLHIIDSPEKPCPPGYKRDKTGDQRSVEKWYVNHEEKSLLPYNSERLAQGGCRGKIIRWTRFHCPNKRFGCPEEGTVAEMKKHIFECYYRWICCAWHLQCGRRRIKLSEYRGHLEAVHRPYIKKVWFNEEEEIVMKTDRNSVVRTGNILRAEGVYFVRRCFLNLQEDVLIISLHIVGHNEEAKQFTYRIKINQGFHRAEYSWTSYCLPYAENVNSCAVLSKCEVLNPSKIFLTKDYLHEIHYTMTIKRIHNDSAQIKI